MRKLALPPDNSLTLSFIPAGRGSTERSPTRNFGPIEPRQGRMVQMTWTAIGAWQFAYLMAFWRTGTDEGSSEFEIDLPTQGHEFETCRAKFVGSLDVTAIVGLSATVQAQATVMPIRSPYALSAASLTAADRITTQVNR